MPQYIYRIPPYIASRSYFAGTDKSCTIITNSYWFTNLILEDTSSDLWSILPRKFTFDALRSLLPTVNIAPDDEDNLTAIRDFLETLRAEGAVQVEGSENPKPIRTVLKNRKARSINVGKVAEFHTKLTEAGLLATGFIELTYRCNEKCVHCLNPRIQYDDSMDLTTAEMIKVINDLYTAGIYDITFSGGEASLRGDLFEILDECRRLNLAITIFTNGLLPEEKLQRLISYYPQTVGVSIYSANPDIHDATTQIKGSWEKSIRTIKTLIAAGIRVVMKCPLMQHTIYGYKELVKLCDTLGAAQQITINLTPTTDGNQQVCRHQVTDINDLTLLFSDSQLTLAVDINEPDNSRRNLVGNERPCAAGVTILSISPNGAVYPCVNMPLTVGNVREQSIVDIWKQSRTLAAWQSIVLNDFNECGMYSECSYCDICPGKAMLETNDVLGKMQALCHTAKVRQNVYRQCRQLPAEFAHTVETFGHDLTFREPQKVFTETPAQPTAFVKINHNGDDFVAQLKQIKVNGNPVRKTITQEPNSPAALPPH
jgi:radical SAM protein with 4Fe4S-binding SPASM domain